MAIQAHPEITPREGAVLSKALLRAAALLEFSHDDLAKVVHINLEELAVIKDGMYSFEYESASFKAATMFVRLFRSLDAIVGGNTHIARIWLHSDNLAFGAAPIEKMKDVVGFGEVVAYLSGKLDASPA